MFMLSINKKGTSNKHNTLHGVLAGNLFLLIKNRFFKTLLKNEKSFLFLSFFKSDKFYNCSEETCANVSLETI